MQDLTDLFFDVATSAPALGFDVAVLLAAGVVGWFPLLRYAPIVGPYVPTARLVAVLVGMVMSFMIGARVMDERAETKSLRIELATKARDLEISEHANADAITRTNEIEGSAYAQHAVDQAYIAQLKANPICGFDPGKPAARSVRVQPAGLFRFFGGSKARSPATAGNPD